MVPVRMYPVLYYTICVFRMFFVLLHNVLHVFVVRLLFHQFYDQSVDGRFFLGVLHHACRCYVVVGALSVWLASDAVVMVWLVHYPCDQSVDGTISGCSLTCMFLGH